MTTNHSVVQGHELKSCPFCGGEAEMEQSAGWHGIYCSNAKCHLNKPRMPSTKEWNARTQTPVTQGRDECHEAFEGYCNRHFWTADRIENCWELWQAAWQRAQTTHEEAGI